MGLFDWFKKNKTPEKAQASFVQQEDKTFHQLNANDRIRKMMEWGDQADSSKLEVILLAILNDTDNGVKMAALKRIHLFTDKERVHNFLTSEEAKLATKDCEPYFS